MALTAVLSLSVAIAALVIGLAAYNALLFRPPSVGNPETLLFIHSNTPSEPFGSMSFAEYTDYQRRLRSFAEVAAFPYSISSITFRNSDRTDQVLATQVSNNFFAVLGVAPRFGTLALRSDGDDGIVISSAFWKKLGSDPRVIGATVRLHDQPVTIAGVVPQAFGGMTLVWEPDVWMSLKTAERVLGSGAPPL